MSAHTEGLLRPLREARRSGERADESILCENHLELEPAGVLDLAQTDEVRICAGTARPRNARVDDNPRAEHPRCETVHSVTQAYE